MDALELVGRCKGGEMSVYVAMVIAHAMLGADTIAPSWLIAHTGQSDKTVTRNLERLKAWGLAVRLTTKKWMLSAEGRALDLPRIPENLRLGEGLAGSGLEVDTVSLRRKFSEMPKEVGESGTSPVCMYVGIKRDSDSTYLHTNQPASRKISDLSKEAQRLVDVLAGQVRMGRRSEAGPRIQALLDQGIPTAQIELDILAYAAHARSTNGRGIWSQQSWILKRIEQGDHAGAHDIAAMPDGPDATRARRLADDLAGIEPEPDEAETPETDDLAAQLEALTLAETARAEGVTDESAAIWERALASIALEIPAATFEAWYRHTQLAERGGRWVVVAPSQHAAEWLAYRGAGCVRRTLRQVGAGGRDVEFVFVSDKE